MKHEDIWNQLPAPPPPTFLNKPERDLVKQVNDELIEEVIGQQILYYPIDLETTNFHPIYGEAIQKNYLPPIQIYCMVHWEGMTTENEKFTKDRKSKLKIFFHKRRLTEDKDLFVREGDFVKYGNFFYEISTLTEDKQLFGNIFHSFEIMANCNKAREGVFHG